MGRPRRSRNQKRANRCLPGRGHQSLRSQAMVRPAVFFLLLSASIGLPSAASAEVLLRWKLKTGDRLIVETQQHIESEVGFSGKLAKTAIDLDVELGWIVSAADDNQFTIKQSVQRVHVRAATGQAAPIEY